MAAYMKLGDIKGDTAADAASDAFAFGPDVAEQHKDHKNWINVASCNMGGHRSGDGDDGTGALANDPANAAAAEPYLQIELKEVLVTSWQTSAGGAGGGSWGLDRIDQRNTAIGQDAATDPSFDLFV